MKAKKYLVKIDSTHDCHGKREIIHALDKPPCYPYIVRVVPARGI